MKESTRSKTLWLLAALAAAFGLINAILFFSSATFGIGWFVTSLVAFLILLVGALTVALREATPGGPAGARGVLVGVDVLHRTRTSEALRADYAVPGGTASTYFVAGTRGTVPLEILAERLDTADVSTAPIDEDAFERRLAARRVDARPGAKAKKGANA